MNYEMLNVPKKKFFEISKFLLFASKEVYHLNKSVYGLLHLDFVLLNHSIH